MPMPELRLSPLVANIEASKTTVIFSKVSDMKSQGEKVNGALCVGQPDFPPPQEAIQATAEAASTGITTYTGLTGTLECRQAICEYLETCKGVKYAPDEIVLSCGGKQTIFQVVVALCQAGDEVVIPSPYWTSYPDIVKLSGATPVFLETTAESGFVVKPDMLAKVLTPKTRLLFWNNPSNPTGCAMDHQQQEAIAALLRRPEFEHILVLSDEIYERITYDGLGHVSFATLEGMRDRTLTVNGFSKAFAMTGYRLGYLAAPKPIAQVAAKLQSQITSCASSIAQHAAIAALRSPKQYIDEKVVELQAKRDKCLELLLAIPDLVCRTPQGAFYLFPDIAAYFGRKTPKGEVLNDANAICMHLLDEFKVALVPGEAFGAPRCLRISYAATMENIVDGVTKLGQCLQSLVK
mmetsp:Transcript_20022/g.46614  ORF Transcript_20022/g.46614 Transcript_20022/m.46614 type:complete len:408 (-) Transcript_20022:152-1375(-)